ncbi:hypothetical protein [Spirosoma harenae]
MSTNAFGFTLIIAILLTIFAWSSLSETTGSTIPKNTFRGNRAEVDTIASTYTHTLMREFNPRTGRNPHYTINSWHYAPDTDVYTIDLTASWSGKPDVWSRACTSELNVVCHAARDGSTVETEQPRINACIEAGQRSDLLWNALVKQLSQKNVVKPIFR